MALAAAGGLFFRLVPDSPLWLDEALSVNIADRPFGQIDDALRRDGHPPLYYYLLSLWMKAFGTGDAAVRALSVVLSLLGLALVVAVVRRHAGRETSTFAAFLFMVLPFSVRYGSETRMYALVMVLVLAGWIALVRAVERPTITRLVPLGLLAGLLALTHYWSLFLLAAAVLLLAAHAWFTPPDRRSHSRAAAAICCGGILFIPWLSAFLYQLAHTGTPWAPRARPTRVVSESLADFAGGLDPESVISIALLSMLLVVGVFGWREQHLILGRAREVWASNAFAFMALTVVLGAVASFAGNSAFAGRYAAVFFPIFVVLVARGIATVGVGWTRTGAIVMLAGLCLVASGLEWRRDRTQLGDIATMINGAAAAGDVVVVCPDQLGPALQRELRDDVVAVAYPELGDTRLVDWVDYKRRHADVDIATVAAAIDAKAAAARSVWVVFSSGYRVTGTQCDRLVEALAVTRPRTEALAAPDGGQYFENAGLRRFDRA